jgi:hypothetical protein
VSIETILFYHGGRSGVGGRQTRLYLPAADRHIPRSGGACMITEEEARARAADACKPDERIVDFYLSVPNPRTGKRWWVAIYRKDPNPFNTMDRLLGIEEAD